MHSIKLILGAILSFTTCLLGGFDRAIQVLTTLIVVDYITGIMKAGINQLNKSVILKGFSRLET